MFTIIKTHGSELRGQEATKRTPIQKTRGHYCELFTCRVGFAILVLDYATSLNRFVWRYMIRKSLGVVIIIIIIV